MRRTHEKVRRNDLKNEEAVAKIRGNTTKELLTDLADLAGAFDGVADWSADAAKAALGEVAASAGAKPGQWMFPLRVALSGRAHGPDIGDILTLLGRDRCVARLRGFGRA